jgi:ribonuclease PH
VEVQATAEHEPFDEAQMSQLVDLARIGIADLVLKQREIIGD